MEFINKKKFAKAAFNKSVEAFVVHIASLASEMLIHPARKAQIASFVVEKLTIPAQNADFADISSKKLAKVLPKQAGINKHAIELEKNKQLP